MAKILHAQYMPKKYGGSETLISLLKYRSKHSHELGYAQRKFGQETGFFYQKIISDFEEHAKNQDCLADIVHTHFIFGGIPFQETGIPTVCGSHCLFSEEFKLAQFDTSSTSDREELLQAHDFFSNLEQKFYPVARNLIVHSEFHKKELELIGGKPTYLELPLNVSDFDLKVPKSNLKKAIGIPDKFTLLFLGRPTYLKGFSVLAEAFEKLPSDMQLLVVGDFGLSDNRIFYSPCVNADSGNQEMRFFDVGDRVFVRPPVDHTSSPVFFGAADVLICPSFYEAVGYVNLEAMASSTFVIGSNTAGIPYVVDNRKTGLLFETGNSTDLARKIIEAYSDRRLSEQLIANARDYVEKYDLKKIIPKYDELYSKVGELNV